MGAERASAWECGPARLIVADDHRGMREGLKGILADEPDLEVVGEAADGRGAEELCHRLGPELVLMDARMPGTDGLEATRKIKRAYPATVVLVVTAYEDPDYLLGAIRAGAAGYILKDADDEEILSAIRRALSGKSPLHEELAASLLRRLTGEEQHEQTGSYGEANEALPHTLTPRELDVLGLLVEGKTNRQISATLFVSVSTVKLHVQRIIAKLEVSDRTQAAVRAIELGIISPPGS